LRIRPKQARVTHSFGLYKIYISMLPYINEIRYT
jgi:hypothetical protein